MALISSAFSDQPAVAAQTAPLAPKLKESIRNQNKTGSERENHESPRILSPPDGDGAQTQNTSTHRLKQPSRGGLNKIPKNSKIQPWVDATGSARESLDEPVATKLFT